ncbi:MAG TPA: GtrA family protein [Acidimicrobiales bacterium]
MLRERRPAVPPPPPRHHPALIRFYLWLRHSRTGGRATRSFVGSVVATACSEVVFIACYGTSLLGTTGSSAAAFVAGAIPNYVLNRSWAWQRHGRVRIWREVVLYIVVSLVSFAAAALATGWAGHAARHLTSDHLVKTGLVSAAYLGTYAVLLVAKFLAYELVIFADPAAGPSAGGTSSPTGR